MGTRRSLSRRTRRDSSPSSDVAPAPMGLQHSAPRWSVLLLVVHGGRLGLLPETAPFRGGCRINPRRGRWIASKGGFRNRPSRRSRARGPSQGRPARRLWRALPRVHGVSSQTALCDSLTRKGKRAERAGGAIHITFVDDLDARVADIASRGIEPDEPRVGSNRTNLAWDRTGRTHHVSIKARKAIYRDADGNEIGFGGAIESVGS